jgi:hypothetical protein
MMHMILTGWYKQYSNIDQPRMFDHNVMILTYVVRFWRYYVP